MEWIIPQAEETAPSETSKWTAVACPGLSDTPHLAWPEPQVLRSVTQISSEDTTLRTNSATVSWVPRTARNRVGWGQRARAVSISTERLMFALERSLRQQAENGGCEAVRNDDSGGGAVSRERNEEDPSTDEWINKLDIHVWGRVSHKEVWNIEVRYNVDGPENNMLQ